MSALPVLWLYGSPGVGKTTVAWELFTELAADGTPTGYVDVDQLGMCYAAPTPEHWAPEPASDPFRYRLEAGNLDAVVANFHAAGARCVVASGVVDPVRGPRSDLVPHAALTPCRLRAEPDELLRRLARRGNPNDDLDGIRADAAALDRRGADLTVDTTGLGVADVLALVRKQIGAWPGEAGPPPGAGASTTAPGEILLLSGPSAVGKSTVGWRLYQRARHCGFRTAFVDLDQLGFRRPVPAGDPGNHRLKAANLAAVWQRFRASGADSLIAVGPLGHPDALDAYTAALPNATIRRCELHAGLDELTERVLRRGRGLRPGWGLAGDELFGAPEALLRRIAEQAAADSTVPTAGTGERVDTDGRTPEDVAEEVLRRAGWPALCRRLGYP
jgi:hypothetical protein